MIIEMTTYHWVSLAVVIVIVVLMILLDKTTKPKVVPEVRSAYVVHIINGKVTSTATLTFRDNFVVSQDPANRNMEHDVPNFVGRFKTEVTYWADNAGDNESRSVTFS